MQPVWQFLAQLDTFEAVAFWIAAFVATLGAGFFLDYLMQKQGFGVIFNSIFVGVGVCLGLYARLVYVRPGTIPLGEPMLTIVVLIAATTALICGMALVRNRFS